MKRAVFLTGFVCLFLSIWFAGCKEPVEDDPVQLQFPGYWQLEINNEDIMNGTAFIEGTSEKGVITFTFSCEGTTRSFKGPYQAYGQDIFAKLSVDWFPGLTYHLSLTGSIGDDGTISGISTYENLFGEFTGSWSAVPLRDTPI